MEVKTRLVISDPNTANLYLPKKLWKELVTKLNSNRMTVVLRIEGMG